MDLVDTSPEAVAEIITAGLDPEVQTGDPPLGVLSANLDHVYHFGIESRWAGALRAAELEGRVRWLTLLDGNPLVRQANRLTGWTFPRLAGSDLMWPILTAAARKGLSVGILGGGPEAHDELKRLLASRLPSLRLAGCWAPSRRDVGDPEASASLAGAVRAARVDLLFVGLGKPRQELWIANYGSLTGARVLLAFGAAADFLAGAVTRAPAWMVAGNAEWLFRLLQEPRRLSGRYLVRGPVDYVRMRRASSTQVMADGTAGSSDPRGRRGVSAIIVTHNSAQYLEALLRDLQAERARSGAIASIIVKDNGSTDDTLRLARAAGATLHPDTRNLGYAGGINAAIALAGDRDDLLILNPDVRLAPGALLALRDRLSRPCVGAVVPRIVDPQGFTATSLRFEPNPIRALGDAIAGDRLPTRPTWLTETDRDPEAYVWPHPVEWATGAAILIRSEVARTIGRWDERFFMYSEETDYFRRLRKHGWQVWYEPSATITHIGGGSGQSGRLAALLAVNRVRYAELAMGSSAARRTRVATLLGTVLRSHRADQRAATRFLLRRSTWHSLPRAQR